MKKVTIQRSKWQRGGASKTLELFPEEFEVSLWGTDTESGCCLGHCLHQAHGISYKSMRGECDPVNLANSLGKKNPLVLGRGTEGFQATEFTGEAININDRNSISDEEREQMLCEWFEKHGYELTFVD